MKLSNSVLNAPVLILAGYGGFGLEHDDSALSGPHAFGSADSCFGSVFSLKNGFDTSASSVRFCEVA
jgi:hypothetical protein